LKQKHASLRSLSFVQFKAKNKKKPKTHDVGFQEMKM